MSEEAQPELNAAYAPPAVEADSAQGTAAEVDRDARSAGYEARTWFVRLLCALLLVDALLLGFNFSACALVASALLAASEEMASASRVLLQVHQVIYLAAAASFAWFLFGCNKNARAFVRTASEARALNTDAENEDDESSDGRVYRPAIFNYSPASMVWWFFVPVLSWFKPYSAVKVVWQSSRPERSNRAEKSDSLILLWWLTHLLWQMFALPLAAFTSALSGASNRNLFAAAQNLAGCIVLFLTLRLVLALHERQLLRAAELWPAR